MERTTLNVSFPYDKLSRWPDVEAPDLLASDTADKLLVSQVAELLETRQDVASAPVAIIGDTHGALTLACAIELGIPDIRVHQDARSSELALAHNREMFESDLENSRITQCEIVPELVSGAKLVVMRLPRSLEQLEHWAALIAAHADQDVIVFAGGRLKHMTTSMNDVLSKFFESVTASLAHQKSRVLTATGPQKSAAAEVLASYPIKKYHVDIDLTLCSFGGVFAGTSVDIGTRDLLAVLDRVPGKQQQHIIDFGCGTGVLAAQVSKLRPTATVIATDQSWAAVRSAEATMRANNLDSSVTVVRDDGLSSQPDSSADLILFNPPFHSGAAVHAGTSLRLFAEAGRVLKPGGELWVVANRHLSYKPALRKLVGETREVRRTPKFTVTKTIKA